MFVVLTIFQQIIQMNKQLFNKYLKYLNEGDLKCILKLFEDDAIVISPIYGESRATSFYKALFSDTKNSNTKLIDISKSIYHPNIVMLHFNYVWNLRNGDSASFDCIDIFELNTQKDKFSKLTIIYDTASIKP
jgi:hypothetical protein